MHRNALKRRTATQGAKGIALVTAAGFLLSACSASDASSASSESDSDISGAPEETVVIAVDSSYTEQVVLGEVYRQLLGEVEHPARVIDLAGQDIGNKIDSIKSTEANFIIGCTGDLLAEINPTDTLTLLDEISSGSMDEVNSNDLTQRTYDDFVGSLPGDVQTTDPSPAHGCAETQRPELAQNIVPVFSKGLFTREETGAINQWTRGFVTDELQEVYDDVDAGEDVDVAVAAWRAINNPNTSQFDSDAEDQ